MNVNSFLSPRLMAGAAIVGLVGAAGVFIYEQVYAEKRRAMLGKQKYYVTVTRYIMYIKYLFNTSKTSKCLLQMVIKQF